MPTFRNFDARVTVDGKPLREYGIRVDKEAKKSVCWIPSTVGKSFTVVCQNKKPTSRTKKGVFVISLYLDGNHEERIAMDQDDPDGIIFEHRRISSTVVRPFVFASIPATENVSPNVHEEMGEIQLIIMDGTEMALIKKHTKFTAPGNPVSVCGRVASTIPHQIVYGNEVARDCRDDPNEGSVQSSYSIGNILASFIFKYRPLEVLQQQLEVLTPRSLVVNEQPSQSSHQAKNVMKRKSPAAGGVEFEPLDYVNNTNGVESHECCLKRHKSSKEG